MKKYTMPTDCCTHYHGSNTYYMGDYGTLACDYAGDKYTAAAIAARASKRGGKL